MNQGNPSGGMGIQSALRLEFFIIGLGILALLMIFQPFSITLFTLGSIVVVVAVWSTISCPWHSRECPSGRL